MKKTASCPFTKYRTAGITAQKTRLFGISSSIWFWRGIGYNKILQTAACRLSACRLPFAQSEIIRTRWISISKIVTWLCLRRPPSFPPCRKRGGRKGALRTRLVYPASAFWQETDLVKLISHQLTSPESYYAPPVISVSNMEIATV